MRALLIVSLVIWMLWRVEVVDVGGDQEESAATVSEIIEHFENICCVQVHHGVTTEVKYFHQPIDHFQLLPKNQIKGFANPVRHHVILL